MSTCNRLDLETLGSQLIMPKNLPGRRFVGNMLVATVGLLKWDCVVVGCLLTTL